VRQLAKKLSGPVASYQQPSIGYSLEDILGQDDTQPASDEPTTKAKKPAKKRSTAVKKTPASKPRSKASRAVSSASVPPPDQDAGSLESPDGQIRKRKTSDAGLESTPFQEVSTQDADQESVNSELSVLGATPEHSGLFGDEPLDDHPVIPGDDLESNALPEIGSAPNVSSSLADQVVDSPASPLPATSIIATVEDAERQTPPGSVAEPASVAPADPRSTIRLKLSPPLLLAVSQSVPSPDQSLDSQDASDPAASLPTPTSVRQRPSRTVKPPARFRDQCAP
jgi:hypothetical protein